MFTLLVSLGVLAAPVVLHVFIGRETADPRIVDRSEAEQLARARGGRPEHSGSDDTGRSSSAQQSGAQRGRGDGRGRSESKSDSSD